MRGTTVISVVVVFAVGLMAGAVTESRLADRQGPVGASEVAVEHVETANNCREISDAAMDVIELFGQFVGVLLDGNAVLAQVGQRAAARGLVRTGETEQIAASADQLEIMNSQITRALGVFEREAAQCFAQR